MIRCATASGIGAPDSESPSKTTSSSAASRRTFRLLEPALTTRTRTPLRAGPRPVARVGRVVADRPRIGPVPQPLVDHALPQPGRPRAEAGHPVDHVHHQV